MPHSQSLFSALAGGMCLAVIDTMVRVGRVKLIRKSGKTYLLFLK